MRRLLRSIIAIWLLLIAACAIALVLGKVAGGDSTLQSVGIIDCGGTACYQTLGVGDLWAEARQAFPTISPNAAYYQLSPDPGYIIRFAATNANGVIKTIAFDADSLDKPLPIDAGSIVAQFGPPCRLSLEYSVGGPGVMDIVYPAMLLRVDIIIGSLDDPQDYRLRPESPIMDLILSTNASGNQCGQTPDILFGSWYGFASYNTYQRHFNFDDTSDAQ